MDLLSHGFTGPAFTAIGQEFYPTLTVEGINPQSFTVLTGDLGLAFYPSTFIGGVGSYQPPRTGVIFPDGKNIPTYQEC